MAHKIADYFGDEWNRDELSMRLRLAHLSNLNQAFSFIFEIQQIIQSLTPKSCIVIWKNAGKSDAYNFAHSIWWAPFASSMNT